MKSLLSTLVLGSLLIGSHITAAPAGPTANSTDLAAPAPTDSNALSSDDSADIEEFRAGPTSFDQMNKKYQKYIKKTLTKRRPGEKCTLDNVSIRKEW
jgi:hypothetical protein